MRLRNLIFNNLTTFPNFMKDLHRQGVLLHLALWLIGMEPVIWCLTTHNGRGAVTHNGRSDWKPAIVAKASMFPKSYAFQPAHLSFITSEKVKGKELSGKVSNVFSVSSQVAKEMTQLKLVIRQITPLLGRFRRGAPIWRFRKVLKESTQQTLKDKVGNTLLNVCAHNNHKSIIKTLLRRDTSRINTQNHKGNTSSLLIHVWELALFT